MKKNKGLFFSGLVLTSFWCSAQTVNQGVIAPAGNLDKTDKVELNWTVGEPAVKTVFKENEMVTEGFHQSTIKVISSEQIDPKSNYHFSIAPNPVTSTFTFKSFSDDKGTLVLHLTNENGKTLSVLSASSNDSKDIDMSAYVSGLYLLSIMNAQGNVIQTFRIVKTQ